MSSRTLCMKYTFLLVLESLVEITCDDQFAGCSPHLFKHYYRCCSEGILQMWLKLIISIFFWGHLCEKWRFDLGNIWEVSRMLPRITHLKYGGFERFLIGSNYSVFVGAPRKLTLLLSLAMLLLGPVLTECRRLWGRMQKLVAGVWGKSEFI